MHDAGLFSPSYSGARSRLLGAATRAGAELTTFRLPGHVGAEGEPLATDMLWFGPRNPRGLMMVTSGLHGVEGFAGSAAQLSLAHQFAAAPPPEGIAVALVHALNPHGFSHLQRTNEDNVDLNRNFITFDAALPEASEYDALHPLVAPAQWDGPGRAAADRRLAEAWSAMTPRDFQQAVCQGQHVHPTGLFYGGTAPAWSNTTLRGLIAALPAGLEFLVHIDIHTGLGPYGVGELLYTLPPDSPAAGLAGQWYGAIGLRMAGNAASSATLVRGTMNNAFRIERPPTLSISIEFGTVAFRRMFEALRESNLVRMHAIADEGVRGAAAKELRRCFDPDDDWWRGAVLQRCDEVFHSTLGRLQSRLGAR